MKLKSILINLFFILIINACQDSHSPYQIKEDSEIFSCTIKGGSNKEYVLNAISFPPGYASNLYLENFKGTVLEFFFSEEKTALFTIKGNSIGKYKISENDSNRVILDLINNKEYFELKNGQIEIIKYGNLNEYVEGNFSGTGIIVNDSLKETFAEINGKFKALRIR